MPRFVILRHECPTDYLRPSHWDVMFEVAGALRTWALVKLPNEWVVSLGGDDRQIAANQKQQSIGCEELGLHRLDYLTFEGPLTDNRGNVQRIEEGRFRVLAESHDMWELQLAGTRLSGRLRLNRSHGDSCYWRVDWSSD
jgi:hypothetical protein